MKPNPQLQQFLSPYPKHVQQLTLDLRDFLTELVPEANELIWDNYNAVAMAYSKSEKLKDAFCHIAVYAKYVNFGFNRGAELSPSSIRLEGTGKLIRHLKVTSLSTFPREALEPMIWEAVSISEQNNPELLNHQTPAQSLVMSVADKKVRPK